MKIAYLSTFYPFRGGIAQFNALLTNAFKELGHEVIPYTFKRQYPDILFPGNTQYVTENDIAEKVDSVPVLDTVNPFSYYATARKIKNFNPDILIMKYWMSFFAPSLGTIAGKMNKNTKVITVLDNVIPHERKFFDIPFTKYFLNRNTGFITMSEAVKKDLLLLKPDAKFLMNPHPIYNHFGKRIKKEEARTKLGLDPNKRTLLFFGFIRDYKGLDLLIESFANADTSYQLLIAGESYGSFDKYQELIDKNPNSSNIHTHIRYIDDNEVPLFFSAADTLILPYKSATQSGISGIALHFKLPQIVTNVGGLVEYVSHGKTGLIVPEILPNAIFESVKKFYTQNLEQEFINNMSKENERYSWKTLASNILEFSDKI